MVTIYAIAAVGRAIVFPQSRSPILPFLTTINNMVVSVTINCFFKKKSHIFLGENLSSQNRGESGLGRIREFSIGYTLHTIFTCRHGMEK